MTSAYQHACHSHAFALLCISAFFPNAAWAQTVVTTRISDRFAMQIVVTGADACISLQPDSTSGDAVMDARSAALHHALAYLFENYANTASYVWKLLPN